MTYWSDGLSSGQEVVLYYLVRFVHRRIHQSVVLIDEVELHQHPLWQQKLLHALPQMGSNVQVVATSHSSYLRDLVPTSAVLGDLGDHKAARTGAEQ